MASEALHDRPVEILQRLLRFDTSNPPGNERECGFSRASPIAPT
jgi:hypothetical protein